MEKNEEEKNTENDKDINMHTDKIECNKHKNTIIKQDDASCC